MRLRPDAAQVWSIERNHETGSGVLTYKSMSTALTHRDQFAQEILALHPRTMDPQCHRTAGVFDVYLPTTNRSGRSPSARATYMPAGSSKRVALCRTVIRSTS